MATTLELQDYSDLATALGITFELQAVPTAVPNSNVKVPWKLSTGEQFYESYDNMNDELRAAAAIKRAGGIPAFIAAIESGVAESLDLIRQLKTGIFEVKITGASGGTFTLTFGTKTTSAIAYNASPVTVSAALAALTTIGADNVAVLGGDGGPWSVILMHNVTDLATIDLEADGALLTGANAAVTVTKLEQGGKYLPNDYSYAVNFMRQGRPLSGLG